MEEKSPYSSACSDAAKGKVTPTSIGGQAVIEGVMMRGKYSWAVTARDAGGVLHSEEHDLTSAAKKHAWMRWPLIRGTVALVESLTLGTKALTISANMAGIDEEAGEDGELPASAMLLSILGGTALAIGLFIILPAFLTNLIMGSATEHTFAWNVVDGLLRLVAFFAYVGLIGLYPDLRRVYQYHGAEHKTIHCFEHGEPLTVENVRKYPRLHVRCGTAFLVMVMAIAILVFSLVPVKPLVYALGVTNKYAVLGLVILIRLLLMPVVAGISYEITVKWAGPRAEKPYVRALLWPGLQMQRLTTAPPTDDMLECAINSMNIVVERERREESSKATDSGTDRAQKTGAGGEAIPAEYDVLDDVL